MSKKDKDERGWKGASRWPFHKLFLLCWGLIYTAVAVNTLIIHSASRLFGEAYFSLDTVLIVLWPVTGAAAVLMVDWIRRLVDEADRD